MNGLNRRNSRTRSYQEQQQPENEIFQNEQEIPEIYEINDRDPKDVQSFKEDPNENKDLPKGWLVFTNVGSELLENKGSVARDHVCLTQLLY